MVLLILWLAIFQIGTKRLAAHGKPGWRWGVVCFVVAAWFLYVPPEGVTTSYFLMCFLCFFLAYTMVGVPLGAWGSELATGYHQRAKVFSFSTACMFLGQIFLLRYAVITYIFQWGIYTRDTEIQRVYQCRFNVDCCAVELFFCAGWSVNC